MCHVDAHTIDRKTYIQLKAFKETFNGLAHESHTVSETVDLDFLNDIHDLIYRRLKELDNHVTLDGYLSNRILNCYQKEVNFLEKHLQVINKLLTITTL